MLAFASSASAAAAMRRLAASAALRAFACCTHGSASVLADGGRLAMSLSTSLDHDFIGGTFDVPGAIITPEDAGYAPFAVSEEYIDKHNPQPGGYFVVYDDGYQSFSPAKAFEEGYTPI